MPLNCAMCQSIEGDPNCGAEVFVRIPGYMFYSIPDFFIPAGHGVLLHGKSCFFYKDFLFFARFFCSWPTVWRFVVPSIVACIKA